MTPPKNKQYKQREEKRQRAKDAVANGTRASFFDRDTRDTRGLCRHVTPSAALSFKPRNEVGSPRCEPPALTLR